MTDLIKSLRRLGLILTLTLALCLSLTHPAYSQVTHNKWRLCPLLLEKTKVLVNPIDVDSLFHADENAAKLSGESEYCKFFENGPRYLLVSFDKTNNKESYIRWLKANNQPYRVL